MSLPTGINEPLPFEDPISEAKTGLITTEWTTYFEQTWMPQTRAATIKSSSYSNGADPLTDALPIRVLEASVPVDGMVLLLIALSIAAAAAVTSSVSVTVTWTHRGIARTATFGPLVNGTPSDRVAEAFPILVDGGTPVSFQTTYASNPANDLEYDLAVSLNLNGLPSLEN